MKTAVVTGASGFVGRALCRALRSRGVAVRAVVRAPTQDLAAEEMRVADLEREDVDWRGITSGADVVFHLAAHVHVLDRHERLDLERFRAVNRDATARIGRAAAEVGVGRFVYLSTIGVHGTRTGAEPFTEHDPPRPANPYAISKWEGEVALNESGGPTDMRIHVLRVPLVYGPGVTAKFLMLLRLVDRGVPLPFASVRNARSMVFLDNVIDALIRVADDPAAGPLYLVADDEALSTPELIRRIAAQMRRSVRLLPLPVSVLRAGARILGRRDMLDPLLDSLVVSTARIGTDLQWRPPVTFDDGLRETIEWYRGRS